MWPPEVCKDNKYVRVNFWGNFWQWHISWFYSSGMSNQCYEPAALLILPTWCVRFGKSRTKTRFLSGVVVSLGIGWLCRRENDTKPLHRPPSSSENTFRTFTSGSSSLSTRPLLNIFSHLKSKKKFQQAKVMSSIPTSHLRRLNVWLHLHTEVLCGADVSLISLVLFCSGIWVSFNEC